MLRVGDNAPLTLTASCPDLYDPKLLVSSHDRYLLYNQFYFTER